MRNNLFFMPMSTSKRPLRVAGALLLSTGVAAGFMHAAFSANAPAAAAQNGGNNDQKAVVSVETVRVTRGVISQPVRAYGIVAASASNLTTVDLPYVARIVRMRVQNGQRVTRGTPLFVVQADPSAVLAAAQAKTALTLAQGELARTQSLYAQGLATQSQLATARKAADDAQEALAAQTETGVASGAATITAPMDGVVLQVSAAQGDQVAAGAAILQLAASANGAGQDARPNVTLGVEPAEAGAIHAGDTVTLHGLSTSLARQGVDGKVLLVGASVDPQSQLVDIGASVQLAQTAFIPGTHVSADIATRSGTHWIVPRAAVLKDAKGAYLFQIASNNTAQRVNVQIQVENGARYGVDGPLDSTHALVTSGNYELKDGMAVRAAKGAAQ